MGERPFSYYIRLNYINFIKWCVFVYLFRFFGFSKFENAEKFYIKKGVQKFLLVTIIFISLHRLHTKFLAIKYKKNSYRRKQYYYLPNTHLHADNLLLKTFGTIYFRKRIVLALFNRIHMWKTNLAWICFEIWHSERFHLHKY